MIVIPVSSSVKMMEAMSTFIFLLVSVPHQIEVEQEFGHGEHFLLKLPDLSVSIVLGDFAKGLFELPCIPEVGNTGLGFFAVRSFRHAAYIPFKKRSSKAGRVSVCGKSISRKHS